MKVSPPNKVCKRCDASRANGADYIIQIEHAITDDLPDGTPTVPGFADDGIRAELIGSDRCEAEGITARGYAPVLRAVS